MTLDAINDPALREVLTRMDERLAVLERRSGVLVIEREHPDGTVDVVARKAGLDHKTLLSTVATIAVPIIVAIIMTR